LSIRNPFLKVEMRHRQGPIELDVMFSLTEPWTVLFGPSGSGKTTILRAIMGFVRPDQATILLRERPIVNTTAHLLVPAHLRDIRYAGQTARLFPGISVRDNVRYGVRSQQAEATLVEELLELFRITRLAEKQPQALSGGERQRVSVARAIASVVRGGGTLLLLDEPFAGLDLALRDALAIDLQAWLLDRNLPVLSVTHDIGEAFLLRADVLRLEDGRITGQGSVEKVLAPERERLLVQLRGQ